MSSSTLRQRHSKHDDVLASSDSETDSPSVQSKPTALTSHLNDYPPFEVPQFSIKEILGAIPAHCFDRSAIRSGAYVVVDFILVALLGYAATYIDGAFNFESGDILQGWAGFAAKWASWAAYWVVQGWVFTGLWVIGHECGHQAFSTSKAINNGVGIFLHSLLLVPYHSWRISHARHHAATGHLTRDEVFVPRTKSQIGVPNEGPKTVVEKGIVLDELLEDAPLYTLYNLVVQQLAGWPAYLFANASGQLHFPGWVNHFTPSSHIFDTRHKSQILMSDAFLIAQFGLLYAFGKWMGHGWTDVVKYYLIPYLHCNHNLVMITYLQHTDTQLPHYSAGSWNFQRGALCTIDRNFLGPVGPYLLHGICETHVAHHLSSKMPHYHAFEATEALKKFLGPHYHYSGENMYVSLWKSKRDCRYVDDEGDVLFYHDAYGRQYRKVAVPEVPSDSGVEVDEE